jgi:hypothetical protein
MPSISIGLLQAAVPAAAEATRAMVAHTSAARVVPMRRRHEPLDSLDDIAD